MQPGVLDLFNGVADHDGTSVVLTVFSRVVVDPFRSSRMRSLG